MTDTSSLAITHATTDSYPVHAHRGSPAAVDGAASDSGAPDEEPYTIKCICSFEEDDGNTVFCEGCETWQHILCYYPDKRVPDVHNCVDCEPRPLDNRRAHERQRQRRIREKSEDGDRRTKRSGAKSHKRKSKDPEVNEYSLGRHDSGAREAPPVKKQKASRRPSTSISGVSGPSGSLAESRNRRSSTSTNSSSLYDREDLFVESKSILNYGVDFLNEIVAWLKDPQILAKVSDGLSAEDFAKRSEAAMDQSRWPSLAVETIPASSVEIDGKIPVHKILKTQDPIRKGDIVGEIFGKLGHVKDYKKVESNRWEELRHAMPFVYFNRQLDLYIDSRQEGNELRHIRRSCDANVLFKIYITNGREYHFCFVAKDDISANSEITFMWHFDENLFPENTLEQTKDRVVDPNDAAIYISNALAIFGGCACGHSQTCAVSKLDRRSKLLPGQKRVKSKVKGKPRRTKSQVDISRADSETMKHPDEHDSALDTRSNSGSTRGRHTGSRDISPTTHQQILPELSSRERRKIANAEKQFEQMALGPVNPKRRKRTSGLSRSTAAAVSSSTHTAKNCKPYHESVPSRLLRTAERSSQHRAPYVDVQTQVYAGDVERAFLRAEHSKRGYELDILHDTVMKVARFSAGNHSREDWAQRAAWEAGDHSVIPSGVIPWWCIYYPEATDDRSHIDLLPEDADRMGIPRDHGPLAMPPRWSFHQSKYPQSPYKYRKKMPILGIPYDPPGRSVQGDVDTRSAVLDKPSFSAPSSDPRKPAGTPYWPSIAAHSFRVLVADNRGNVQFSMPPPHIPSALSPRSTATGGLASPSSHDATSPLPLVPPSGPALVSTPAKKKLSLGDYLIRRGTMASTPTSERSPAPAPTPTSSPGSLHAQHFLAITTVFGDKHEPPHPKTEAQGDKNESSGSPDVSMMDAPPDVPMDVPMEDASESQPTNKQSISS
ncbi:hypothetical protein N7457_005475 [Penicillium paradoxum]|uniref:uncharacterized protein n=1 Tax=Penicillium paradoxum TaxID=176176 RepID=UPI0025472193|nr:uncharacterized protein N7457_005475 [Penicillium paradoxum]KAJ5780315.1 hypothetical protein N7457_005475 [Penicillium paradoxum]